MHECQSDATLSRARSRSRDIADELKTVIRLAGRDPEALAGRLPALSSLYRVTAAGPFDEAVRVHFILYRLIPEYLQRLPAGRDCRAIRELLTWEDVDGEIQSLTTRYHKAATHLVSAASDFGRRQEPRLLLECARRFIALDHEDHLGAPRGPSLAGDPPAPAAIGVGVPETRVLSLPADDPQGGIVRVHRNLDYHQLVDDIADADEIVILNTWIPGIDILADALVNALTSGACVSILLLDPDSHIAQLRSQALQGSTQRRFGEDRVKPEICHCLDVLAAVSSMVSDDSKRNLRVRLYSSLPSISVYGIDDRAFVSFFLHGQLAVKSSQIEVLGQDSVMGQLVLRELETLWNGAQAWQDLTPPPTETPSMRRLLTNIETKRHAGEPAAAATG